VQSTCHGAYQGHNTTHRKRSRKQSKVIIFTLKFNDLPESAFLHTGKMPNLFILAKRREFSLNSRASGACSMPPMKKLGL